MMARPFECALSRPGLRKGLAVLVAIAAVKLAAILFAALLPGIAYGDVPRYTLGQTPIPEPYSKSIVGTGGIAGEHHGQTGRQHVSDWGEVFDIYDNASKQAGVYQRYPRAVHVGTEAYDLLIYTWADGGEYRVSRTQHSIWEHAIDGRGAERIYEELHFYEPGTMTEVEFHGTFYMNNIAYYGSTAVQVGNLRGLWLDPATVLSVNGSGQAVNPDPEPIDAVTDPRSFLTCAVDSTPGNPARIAMWHHSPSYGMEMGHALYMNAHAITYRISPASETLAGKVISTAYVYKQGAYSGEDPHPPVAHHGFSGWYGDASLRNPYEGHRFVTSDLDLWGAYDEDRYSLAFDANGGEGGEVRTLRWSEFMRMPDEGFTRQGYELAGWAMERWGYALLPGMAASGLAGGDGASVTLYAKWEPIPYQVIIEPNGGSGQQGPDWSATDAEYIIPAPEVAREGYAFSHWVDEEGGAHMPGDVVMNLPGSDGAARILTAAWEPISYQVAFDANGGAGSMDAITCIYDDPRRLPACTFTRPGHAFQGWSTTPTGPIEHEDGSRVLDLSSEQDGVVALYAIWDEGADVRIAYAAADPAHASLSRSHEDVAPVTGSIRGCIVVAAIGYVFDGWVDAEGDVVADTTLLEPARGSDGLWHAATYTARTRAARYAIAFDATGGEAAPDAIEAEYGSQVIMPQDAPSYGTRSFLGWSREPGGDICCKPGDALHDLTDEDGATVTLYALWGPERFTVTYEDGQGIILAQETVFAGSDATPPEAPTRYGYAFAGWSAEGTSITGDTLIEATWRQVLHTVTYTDGTGGVLSRVEVVHGARAPIPDDPEKPGLIFAGWDGVAECVEEDMEIDATWTLDGAPALPLDARFASLPQTGDGLMATLAALVLIIGAATWCAIWSRRQICRKGE